MAAAHRVRDEKGETAWGYDFVLDFCICAGYIIEKYLSRSPVEMRLRWVDVTNILAKARLHGYLGTINPFRTAHQEHAAPVADLNR